MSTFTEPSGVHRVTLARKTIRAILVGVAQDRTGCRRVLWTRNFETWEHVRTITIDIAHLRACCVGGALALVFADDPANGQVSIEVTVIIRSASLEPLSLRAIVGAGEEGEGADCDHL